jgi:hypothetical protein
MIRGKLVREGMRAVQWGLWDNNDGAPAATIEPASSAHTQNV